MNTDVPPISGHASARGVAGVLICFVAIVAGVVVFCGTNDRVAADQNLFHLPAIQQFAAQWPRPDLSNYSSATAPGYHLLLAAVSAWVTDDLTVLRCVGATFGFALVGLLAWAAARRSAWLAMPAAASIYVLTSTVWLLPENAAWLLVTAGLLLAMRASGRRFFIGSALVLAALVFVRQSHAWMIGVTVIAAYSLSRYAGGGLGRGSSNRQANSHSADPLPNPPPEYREREPVARIAAFTVLAILPALVILDALVALWHGLTPPAFRPGSGVELPLATKVGGLAPAAPAMVLALVGLFGTPLLAWLLPPTNVWHRRRLALVGGAIGFVIGVVPMTTYSFERRSGIWNAVHALPTVAGRSPLIVALAALGGAVATLALVRLPSRERWVLAAALAGFTLTQASTALVWQRYYEPFVLIWLILAAAPRAEPMTPPQRRLGVAGLVALTAAQLAVTAVVLRRGG